MPDHKTMVTELGTALGALGHADLGSALAARSPAMASLSPELWHTLTALWEGGAYAAEFAAAWDNGQALLWAADGLRGRHPVKVEWKGSHRAPGDEVAPIDLRIDYVYLVSCKYLSKILFNASPAHLFERLLSGGHGTRGGHWYHEVAPAEHQALWETVRGAAPGMPFAAIDAAADDRRLLAQALARAAWPEPALYADLCAAVSERSAARWRENLGSLAQREALLWRLLRIGATPYFVLGASKTESLRLRIATAWDWRQAFELRAFDVAPRPGGQPMVGWRALVRSRHTGALAEVAGHVEVRWSHGRFSGPPEAKVYLDTPHAEVPGYFPLS